MFGSIIVQLQGNLETSRSKQTGKRGSSGTGKIGIKHAEPGEDTELRQSCRVCGLTCGLCDVAECVYVTWRTARRC
jgi:hypothetical protein